MRVRAQRRSATSTWDGYRDLKERKGRPAGGYFTEQEMLNKVILISSLWFWGSCSRNKDNDAVSD